MKKIGILGGTFNPVHNGHLFVAEKVMSHFGLDQMLLIPNGNPPHKHEISASGEERLHMLKLAIEGKDNFSTDDCEMKHDSHSYTFETLQYLKDKYPNDRLYFIAGADNIKEIAHWRNPEKIFALCQVIFFIRPPYQIEQSDISDLEKKYQALISLFELEAIDISATEIRRKIQNQESISELVPQKVAKYINEHKLYMPEYVTYVEQLKELLCPKRFCHTIGVAKMAKKMAKQYGVNEEKAYLAGLLHDCAKNFPEEELRELVKRSSFPIYDGELDNPQLLHSIAGSVIAKEVFEIEEEEILSSIRYHTIGRISMTILEKIIYLADLVEENRTFPLVETMRNKAFESLDDALLLSIDNNIDYLARHGLPVLKETYRIRESILNKEVHI